VPGLLVVAALVTVHAVPLLWRRRAPWASLPGVLAASWLWPAAVAGAALPSRVSQFIAGGALAELLAVYAVAVYGRGAARTWPAWCAATLSLSGVLVATAGADGELSDEGPMWLIAALMSVPLAVVLMMERVTRGAPGPDRGAASPLHPALVAVHILAKPAVTPGVRKTPSERGGYTSP
jgi:hypothetical protein